MHCYPAVTCTNLHGMTYSLRSCIFPQLVSAFVVFRYRILFLRSSIRSTLSQPVSPVIYQCHLQPTALSSWWFHLLKISGIDFVLVSTMPRQWTSILTIQLIQSSSSQPILQIRVNIILQPTSIYGPFSWDFPNQGLHSFPLCVLQVPPTSFSLIYFPLCKTTNG